MQPTDAGSLSVRATPAGPPPRRGSPLPAVYGTLISAAYPAHVSTRTILVVDDEPILRETLVEALASEGFRVVAAADGRAAVERFRQDQPDLVLLDLMLPGLRASRCAGSSAPSRRCRS